MDREQQVDVAGPQDSDEPQVDPHYLELLRTTKLPESYLPAAMAGPQKPWIRWSAALIIGIFTFATISGVCLTYGPGA